MELMVFSAVFASVVFHVLKDLPRQIQESGSVPGVLAASSHEDRQTPQRGAGYLYDWVSLDADNGGLG